MSRYPFACKYVAYYTSFNSKVPSLTKYIDNWYADHRMKGVAISARNTFLRPSEFAKKIKLVRLKLVKKYWFFAVFYEADLPSVQNLLCKFPVAILFSLDFAIAYLKA